MNVFVPLYHGVLQRNEFDKDVFEKRFQKHLPVDEFERQIKWFSENFKLVSAKEFYQKLIVEKSDESFAMITFDDVYANFKTNALAVIEKYRCPVSLFLCSGFATKDRYSWTDEIERVIMNASTGQITVFGRTFLTQTIEERIESVLTFKAFVKKMPVKRQYEAVDVLLSDYDTGVLMPKADMLSWDDYIQLKEHPLVSFYHHTHSHNVLMNEELEDLRRDIDENIRLLGEPVFFAYPYGIKGDHFDDRVKSVIKEKGFQAAFSVELNPNYSRFDIFEIPRKEMRVGDHLKIMNYAGENV